MVDIIDLKNRKRRIWDSPDSKAMGSDLWFVGKTSQSADNCNLPGLLANQLAYRFCNRRGCPHWAAPGSCAAILPGIGKTAWLLVGCGMTRPAVLFGLPDVGQPDSFTAQYPLSGTFLTSATYARFQVLLKRHSHFGASNRASQWTSLALEISSEVSGCAPDVPKPGMSIRTLVI